MELEISQEKPFPSDLLHNSYDNHSRMRAYRHVIAGIRYHKGEKLSFLTIGFKRGTIIDVRLFLQKLTTWVKRYTGMRIDYYRVTVYDNKSPDGKWRIHMHIIWNAPYLKQSLILEKVKEYIGESGSVHIKLLDGNDKKAARYLMQYLGNQDGFVRFDRSRNWLPKGYNEFWNETRRSYYEHVPTGIRKPMDNAEMAFQLMTQYSEDWKKAALYENVDAWIDEQRDKPSRPEPSQGVLYEKISI